MESMEQPTPELLAKRKAALDRKQRQRAREKTRSHQAMVDHLEKLKGDRMNAQHIARRIQRSQCMLGEVTPGVDARTLEEALEVAREMARALTVPDVQEDESLLDFERRVFDAWVNYDKFVGHKDAGGNLPFAGAEFTRRLKPAEGPRSSHEPSRTKAITDRKDFAVPDWSARRCRTTSAAKKRLRSRNDSGRRHHEEGADSSDQTSTPVRR
jgi:hypothetical protein